MSEELNLALFISGRGSTAAATINACRFDNLPVKPVVVIASKPDIPGIQRVIEAGMDPKNVVVIERRGKSPEDYCQELLKPCRSRGVNIVGLYGWNTLIPEDFIKYFRNKIINQHPGPLDPPHPDFGGKKMQGMAVHTTVIIYHFLAQSTDPFTEATAHLVTKEYDKGPVIARRRVDIHPSDNHESLARRVLQIEHELQIYVLQRWATNGSLQTLTRDQPLIPEINRGHLETAKSIAVRLYPHG